jgi:hypothetical protein
LDDLTAFKPLYSAAAYRMADIMNDAIVTAPWSVGHWMAFRLADGDSDGVVYDTRAECVTHQFSEQLCCYVKLIPMGVNAQQCQAMLSFYRAAYDNGHRIIDPEQPDYILPLTNESFRDQVIRLRNRES